MNIYYLDEALNDEELSFAKKFFVEEVGLKEIQSISQIKVPTVLPPHHKGGSSDKQLEEHISLLCNNLRQVGMASDFGQQVMWVMPKDTAWGLRFQLSIEKVTGFMPYVFQRWRYDENDNQYRGNFRILNNHALLQGGA